MDQDIGAVMRKTALLAMVPSWFDKKTCHLGESVSKKTGGLTINVTFNCNCNEGRRKTQLVYVGKRTCTRSMAERISKVLREKHGHHWHTHEAPEPEDPVTAAAAQVDKLKNSLTAHKRKFNDCR